MNKKEAKLQVIWGQYIRQTNPRWYGYFELKQTNKSYFSFDKIENSQILGLPALEKDGFYWKLSDSDMREKPCDCISTPPLPAYLVIKFPDAFYAVRFSEILRMKKEGLSRIDRNEAFIIAEKIIHI
jgi:hypothetical protein